MERSAATRDALATTPASLRRNGILLEKIMATPRTSLFLGPEELAAATLQLKTKFPEHVNECIARAETILSGRFRILGYGELDFGFPVVDWSLDPIGKHRFPKNYWRDYDVMHPPPGADVKVPWELSRCHFLVALGQAWRLTGDERYAARAFELLKAWLDENPVAFSIAWACPMEVAIRAVNWCLAWQLLENSSHFDVALRQRWLCACIDHGQFLKRNPEFTDFWDNAYIYRRCNNNHYLSDLLGCLALGAFFPDVPLLSDGLEEVQQELLAELDCQIDGDGVNWERASGYQKLDVEILLTAFVLSGRARMQWPDAARQRLLRACIALREMTRPDGTLHLFGDHDDGRILALCDPPPDSAVALLCWAAALLDAPTLTDDFPVSAAARASALWRGGAAGASSSPSRPVAPRIFQSKSYVALRGKDCFLGMPLGGVGMLGFSGHSHNDALAVEVFLHGRSVFTDAGSYVYTAQPAEHNWHRSTRAHSTITVDRAEHNPLPDDPALIFSYLEERAKPNLLCVNEQLVRDNREYLCASAECGAYVQIGVTFQRSVLLARDGARVLIEDEVSAEGEHRVEFRFMLAPGLEMRGDALEIFDSEHGSRVAILTGSSDAAALQWTTEPGFCARSYGRREPTSILVASTTARGRLRVRFELS